MNETTPTTTNERPRPSHRAALTGSLVLLFGSDRSLARHDGERLERMWLWLPATALAWGLILATVWAAAAYAFPWWHESHLPLMPVTAILATMALSPFRATLASPAALLERENPQAGGVLSGAVIITLALMLLGLAPPYREATSLPDWLAWLRPPEEYRVLILAPLWGAWAMMTAAHFCPSPADDAPPLLRAYARRLPVAGTALWLAVALGGSLWQLSFLGYGWVIVPSAAAAVAGSLGAVVLCRAAGGLGRPALLAANLTTQLAFLAGYLAAKTHLIR